MASPPLLPLLLLLSALLFQTSLGARNPNALVETQPLKLTYHNGPLLSGPVSANLVWYGNFTAAQRAVVSDFVASLSSSGDPRSQPSVSTWWKTIDKYYSVAPNHQKPAIITLGNQTLDDSYSLGKSLKVDSDIRQLAAAGGARWDSLAVVLTSADVAVDGFCRSRCGTHGSTSSGSVYVWVGDASAQCPGYCAWPFHRPAYGPQTAPLAAPNGDVGADGMVAVLAGLLAGAATNPFGDGFFQGPREAPLEAASACPGVFGRGAYPGYAGELPVDPTSGASYNARGARGRKYLVPALVDPSTAACSTLV
ncbi:putative protein EXORDIUM [Iris pallida]|uniref:Uncharacterized protein n=1 Tax=Iris pallida TaxID=29817 RepID=A0AAX6FJ77_IRIPA|nr:putative protein EXORDIUM [Iris pallida]